MLRIWMEVGALAEKLCAEHSGMVQAISNLKHWQDRQNDSIKDVKEKVDGLNRKIDRLYLGIASTAISTAITLLVTLINLLARFSDKVALK